MPLLLLARLALYYFSFISTEIMLYFPSSPIFLSESSSSGYDRETQNFETTLSTGNRIIQEIRKTDRGTSFGYIKTMKLRRMNYVHFWKFSKIKLGF